jgi:hypothetical protein
LHDLDVIVVSHLLHRRGELRSMNDGVGGGAASRLPSDHLGGKFFQIEFEPPHLGGKLFQIEFDPPPIWREEKNQNRNGPPRFGGKQVRASERDDIVDGLQHDEHSSSSTSIHRPSPPPSPSFICLLRISNTYYPFDKITDRSKYRAARLSWRRDFLCSFSFHRLDFAVLFSVLALSFPMLS